MSAAGQVGVVVWLGFVAGMFLPRLWQRLRNRRTKLARVTAERDFWRGQHHDLVGVLIVSKATGTPIYDRLVCEAHEPEFDA